MQRATLPLATAAFALALLHCVGEDPIATQGGSGDAGGAGGDASVMDSAAGEDAGDSATATDASDAGGDVEVDAGPTLVKTSSLWLWLTADKGITCNAGRITQWADQSGLNHHAVPASGIAPQCEAHTIAGVDVPYFSRPSMASAPYDDEVFNVDLTALQGSAFTIFVVSQYLKQASDPGRFGLIGTLVKSPTLQDGYDTSNNATTQYSALDFSFGRGTSLYADISYDTVVQYSVTVPISAPQIDVLRFDPNVAYQLFHDNGSTPVATSSGPGATTSLTYAGGGSIGRALLKVIDSRFYGYIAEVAVYKSALNDNQIAQLFTYGKAHWNL
jgi:hypothetical protein